MWSSIKKPNFDPKQFGVTWTNFRLVSPVESPVVLADDSSEDVPDVLQPNRKFSFEFLKIKEKEMILF